MESFIWLSEYDPLMDWVVDVSCEWPKYIYAKQNILIKYLNTRQIYRQITWYDHLEIHSLSFNTEKWHLPIEPQNSHAGKGEDLG